MMNIAQTLKRTPLSDNRLDAEILLAHVLKVPRSYLHAFAERELTAEEQNQFNVLLLKRIKGEPIAYLTGQREFWSLDLQVTVDTLIPRPETELLVELVLATPKAKTGLLADLGTGSGAIALALAHENPHWQIDATDVSVAALEVAKNNAARLQINNIDFYQGSWCDALPRKLFDIIVSNPPYIAENDEALEPTVLQHEPRTALIAADNGLSDLQQIILVSRAFLKSGGLLFLEHGFKQAESVRSIFSKAGYNNVTTHRDLADLDRVTIGQWT